MGIHDMGAQPAHTQALSYLIHWQPLQKPIKSIPSSHSSSQAQYFALI
jgi:hypothetical protein